MALSIFPSPQSTSLSHTSPTLTCPDKLILCASPPRDQSTKPRSLWKTHCTLSTSALMSNMYQFFHFQPVSYFIIPHLCTLHLSSYSVCVRERERERERRRQIYLQSVCGQRLGSFHDDLLNPLDWQVTSSLLQTLTEEADHLKVTGAETANHNTEQQIGQKYIWSEMIWIANVV